MKKEILKKLKNLNKNSRFMVTITVVDQTARNKDIVDTFLFTNNFPREELDETKKVIIKLIKEQKSLK
ncbi:MAG: hypothetical protein WC197_00230 [Candidatus Gastranaerophilaceae bacterium]|jgi:hypothetical protein